MSYILPLWFAWGVFEMKGSAKPPLLAIVGVRLTLAVCNGMMWWGVLLT